MKKTLLSVSILATGLAFAQVGINTDSPVATFEVAGKPNSTSTIDGLVAPKISLLNLNAKSNIYTTSQTGAIIFVDSITGATGSGKTAEVDSEGYYYYDGTKWTKFKSTTAVNTQDLFLVGDNNHITIDGGNSGTGTDAGTGSNNIGLGKKSLNSITTGSNNISMGENSLETLTTGSHNIALGQGALKANTTNSTITAIGNNALAAYNTTPTFASEIPLAIGSNALAKFNDTGMGNMAIGNENLQSMISGSQNTSVGYSSLRSLTTGSQNTSLGYKNQNGVTTESGNVTVGYRVGQQGKLSKNTLIGSSIGSNFSNVLHDSNTFIGHNITQQNPHSVQYSGNTAVGSLILNTVIPTPSPTTPITKIENSTFLGNEATIDATAIGNLATPLTTISYASAIGAGSKVISNHSIVLGRTGTSITTRDKIGIGTAAPTHVLHVKENVADTDPVKIEGLIATTDNTNNLVAVDTNGVLKKMDKSVITNNIYTTNGTIIGDRTVTLSGTNNKLKFTRTPTPATGTSDYPVMEVDGSVQTFALRLDSDARLKENIKPINGDLALSLNPVTYNWNKAGKDKGGNNLLQYGFIAQEVEKVMPDAVYTDKDGYKSVNYIEVIPVLAQKIKDQDAIINKLIKRVEELEANTKK